MQQISKPMPAWWKKRWEDLTPAEKDEVREYIRQLKRNPTRPTVDDAVALAARRRGRP